MRREPGVKEAVDRLCADHDMLAQSAFLDITGIFEPAHPLGRGRE